MLTTEAWVWVFGLFFGGGFIVGVVVGPELRTFLGRPVVFGRRRSTLKREWGPPARLLEAQRDRREAAGPGVYPWRPWD